MSVTLALLGSVVRVATVHDFSATLKHTMWLLQLHFMLGSVTRRVKCLVALMMEAASTSETSVNFYRTTRRNKPEDSHLYTRRRENLKSHSF
jgi:hypothetical protein